MTRDEIEEFSRVEPNCFETDKEEDWYKIGCIDGLEAADLKPTEIKSSVLTNLFVNSAAQK